MSVHAGEAKRFTGSLPRSLVLSRTTARRLRADRVARWVVSVGGLAIIASILGILFFILIEVLPLFSGATVNLAGKLSYDEPEALALLTDEHRTHLAVLGADGTLRILRTSDGGTVLEKPLLGPVVVPPARSGAEPSPAPPIVQDPRGRILEAHSWPTEGLITASTSDGRVVLSRIRWEVSFDEQKRIITPRVQEPVTVPLDPEGRPIKAHTARVSEDGGVLAAGQLESGALAIVRRDMKEDFLTGETVERESRSETLLPFPITKMISDRSRSRIYAGSGEGGLLSWPLAGSTPGSAEKAEAEGSAVTALGLLVGDRTLVVGQQDGSISVWFRVQGEEGGFTLERIRDFPSHPGPVRLIAPSLRDKGFLALDESGRMGLYYSTTHRTLWTGESPVRESAALTYAAKGDGAYVAGAGALAALNIDNPHPQISLRALFGRVWYERYPRPEFVWQSSSATDDFEPKLSLTPLLAGTLKGTFYSLLLAIPLAVLGAMYAAHLMHPGLKRYVKPTIEIMAAFPTVVLGFLAGLWLAPRVEKLFPALLLMGVLLPPFVLLTGRLVRGAGPKLRRALPSGAEVIPFMAALALGVWACLTLSEPFEAIAFGGDFRQWLTQVTGLAYDQRNAIVVGMAMGFAVIPIIFSISEDAFANVPRNLVSGSLALGATRWQTVTRVVLPTASPGIFSAVMIGFGRAVGETMIVLMATGNTPIMDWSPFNGFRTLSANIAVEIPEAPQGDTLYRTLFLAALLLFVMTFIVNTVAEIVRQRLRRRFALL